jgi:catechol 2,3-dioxygenase
MTEYGVAAESRLPSEAHPGRVRLQIADLDRSIAFYESVLGLNVVERGPGTALLGPGDGAGLIEVRVRAGARSVARRPRLGLFHFALLVPDRATLGRFVAHLVRLGMRVGSADHLVSEAVYLSDPDGLGIEVYADRPRRTWQVRNGELMMATDPLDVDGLVAAGGGAPWVAMPAGTTLGHVHLHVGDLEGAEAFYHRALGLDKIGWSYPGALFMSAGGYHHHLGTNVWAAGAPAAAEDEARLLEWEMVLPSPGDVEQAAARLAAAGYRVDSGPASALAHDPWGTAVRLIGRSWRGSEGRGRVGVGSE